MTQTATAQQIKVNSIVSLDKQWKVDADVVTDQHEILTQETVEQGFQLAHVARGLQVLVRPTGKTFFSKTWKTDVAEVEVRDIETVIARNSLGQPALMAAPGNSKALGMTRIENVA